VAIRKRVIHLGLKGLAGAALVGSLALGGATAAGAAGWGYGHPGPPPGHPGHGFNPGPIYRICKGSHHHSFWCFVKIGKFDLNIWARHGGLPDHSQIVVSGLGGRKGDKGFTINVYNNGKPFHGSTPFTVTLEGSGVNSGSKLLDGSKSVPCSFTSGYLETSVTSGTSYSVGSSSHHPD